MANNSVCSVGNEMAFSALPIEVQELARKVLDKDARGYSADDIKEAYTAGWEDACGYIETPYYDSSYAEDYLKSI